MKIQYKNNLLKCVTFLFFLILNSSAQAGTGPQGLTLQGTILTANSLPEESASVVFTIQIKSPGAEGCLLFQENQTLNMTSSGGAFSFVLGSGTRSGSGFALTSTIPQVFTNAAVAIGPLTCAIGNSYTPASSDSRKVILTFDDGSGPQTVTQALNVESVPYSIYADYLQDKQPTDFVQVNTLTAAVSQANLESIFASAANVTKLSNLIAGTSTQYITAGTSTFAGDVTLNGAGTGLAVTSATASTSSSTGAEVISGGLGVAGAIYTGGAINAGGAIAATGAISSSSTISSSTSITTPIIYGSSNASGNLTLDSTSNATKGYVLLAPSGGNVGIGTTAPGSALDVRSPNYPVTHIQRDKVGGGAFIYGGADLELTNTTPVANNGIGFFLKAPNSGGTGTWSGMFGGRLSTITSGSEIGDIAFTAAYHGADPSVAPEHLIIRSTSASTGNVLIPNGNVGIGTSSPLAALHIGPGATGMTIPNGVGASTAPQFINEQTSGMAAAVVGVNDGTNNRRLGMFVDQTNSVVGLSSYYSTGSFPFVYRDGSGEKLRIDTNGNVGIETTTPAAKLDINGGVKIGNDAGGCSSTNAGTVKYSGGTLAYCDGSVWIPISPGASSTGSQTYMTPGTYNWTVPIGVYSVSVVAIAGGGGGGNGNANNSGGGGGALCYANNIAVTPGSSIAVVVGSGGAAGLAGADSTFNGTNIVAHGGSPGAGSNAAGGVGGTGSALGGVCFIGGNGGGFTGSGGSFASGGGGGAGYSGNGGQGGNSSGSSVPSNQTSGSGGGGGGGGGASSATNSSNGPGTGGGGVFPFGIGPNGGAGSSSTGNGVGQSAGLGGSFGGTGSSCSGVNGGSGGKFGGGGGGGQSAGTGGAGADGAVRIVWGAGRSYPSNAN